jgi:disulfide bond formation protein DsbB
MDLLFVSNFLAILVLVAGIGSLATIGLWLAARFGDGAAGLLERVRDGVGPGALWLAWLVAAVAMSGSLYFSEIAGLVPCVLCWYQRIAMYPLAVILLLAAIRGDWAIRPYATILAGIGAVISTYHALLQRIPSLPSGGCSLEVPCSAIELERFGFITIPVMALVGFATILVLLWVIGPPRIGSRTVSPPEPMGGGVA